MTTLQAQTQALKQLAHLTKIVTERPCVLGCGPGVNNLGDMKEVVALLDDACKLLD